MKKQRKVVVVTGGSGRIGSAVFILDECTNSLDLETEKQIINEVNFLKGKKTIIMIAHRLSTLENCDCIYKIDKEGLKLEEK